MDIKSLWNFSDPAASEALFRERLKTSRGDDALSLQTQIARSLGLRSRFDEAHALLDVLEPQLVGAGAEPRVRYLLERGRAYRSAKKPGLAKPLFLQAVELAGSHKLDELAVDAMHMVALVEPAAADQLQWNQRALVLAQASRDANARSWEASLANNIGMTLHTESRYDAALASFKAALAARERSGQAGPIRIAHWMIAWTLRALKRHDEALAILRRLEREFDAIKEADGYVFEEIAENLLVQGQAAQAKPYFARAHQVLSADTSPDRPDAAHLARLLELSK
jgi:tetratricopeptide (TPR) repeat protein